MLMILVRVGEIFNSDIHTFLADHPMCLPRGVLSLLYPAVLIYVSLQ